MFDCKFTERKGIGQINSEDGRKSPKDVTCDSMGVFAKQLLGLGFLGVPTKGHNGHCLALKHTNRNY
eukprot:598869-Amphidinium_carterae.1